MGTERKSSSVYGLSMRSGKHVLQYKMAALNIEFVGGVKATSIFKIGDRTAQRE